VSNESHLAKNAKSFISPMLSVRNGAKAVEFYKAAFGTGELFRIENESGAVFAQLSVGDLNSGRCPTLCDFQRVGSTSPPFSRLFRESLR
jgi:hypothetical protein